MFMIYLDKDNTSGGNVLLLDGRWEINQYSELLHGESLNSERGKVAEPSRAF